MSLWSRIAEAGVDASLPRREARHVRALNTVSVLFALLSTAYLPLFLVFYPVGLLPAAIDLIMVVLWASLPVLNRRHHYDLARRLSIPTSVVQVALITLCCSSETNLHYYFIGGLGFPFAIFPRWRVWELTLHVVLLILAFYAMELFAETAWLPVTPQMLTGLRASMMVGLVVFSLIIAINAYMALVRADDEIEAAHAQSERLLVNILPGPIAERLKAGALTIADAVPSATIVFADIVDFTRYSRQMSAAELVHMLDEVFSRFDALLPIFGLEKIKTIGDAYMAASGILPNQPQHTAHAAEMALAMQALMRGELGALYPGLQVRIGLHAGPIVAGVIGQTKFAYDVWGETVNIASRMESHSTPGSIQVGRAVHDALRHEFTFEPRGFHEVKGMGELELFFLTGKRTQAST